jgi:hypothetical protein
MKQLLLAVICCCTLLPGLQAQPEQKYLGHYKSNDVDFQVAIDKKNDVFVVQFLYEGQRYEGTAFPLLGMLSGTYPYQGNDVGFTISKILGQYFFTSEGNDVPIERLSEKPVVLKAIASTAPVQTTQSVKQPVTTTAAVSAQPATTHAGKKVTDESMGLSFVAPQGFQINKDDEGNHLLSETANSKWAIAVGPGFDNDKQSLMREMGKPFELNGHVSTLKSAQYFGENGVVAEHSFSVKGENIFMYIISLVSPYGSGASVTLVSNNIPLTAQMRQTAQSVARSVVFIKSNLSGDAQKYHQRIKGQRLLYMYTGNGLSEKWHYDLCSDGSYRYSSNTSYLSGGFSAVGNDGKSGTWKVISRGNQTVLILQGRDGIREFNLTTGGGGELLLNGKHYFVTDNQTCR